MNSSRIRNFLLQQPKPALLRVIVDGEPSDIKPAGRTYQKLAETIEAMDGEKLQCLDAEGKVLRAMRLDDADARRSEAAEIPPGIAMDPHALMLTHFANLIHRAYEHSTEIAFNRMVDSFDRINDRSSSIEQRLERAEALARRLREEQVEDAIELAQVEAEQSGGLENTIAHAFLSGQMNRSATGAGAGKPNGKANGAGKVNGHPPKGSA